MEKIGKKLKHDHTLTSILKFAIFSMVMLAPIFSVASRCLYVICNKNAKDSYSSNVLQNTIEITQKDQMVDGATYNYIKANKGYQNYTSGRIGYKTISINWNDYISNAGTREYHAFKGYPSYIMLWYYDSNQQEQILYGTNNITLASIPNFSFTSDIQSTGNYEAGNYALIQVVYKELKLDNAFEYSLSQLEDSGYYNWATNLGIYTPINNMVSGLGGHSVISLLLAYWSIYTAIYIVFDIIITCFVKITHLIQGE